MEARCMDTAICRIVIFSTVSKSMTLVLFNSQEIKSDLKSKILDMFRKFGKIKNNVRLRYQIYQPCFNHIFNGTFRQR